MDSFELTKIAGAVLSALLLIFGFKTLVNIRAEHAAELAKEKPGYTLTAGGETKAAAKTDVKAGAGEKAAEGAAPAGDGGAAAVLAALPKANAENGKTVFKKCLACHTIEKGHPKAIGPNLWGVINRPKASFPGFEYSPGMKGKGGNWTFEDIATFISKPKAFVPDTKMVFAGLAAPDAADVIAYLARQNDNPVSLPK